MHGLARYPAPSNRNRAWDVPGVGSTEEEERDSQKSIERWWKQREGDGQPQVEFVQIVRYEPHA